MDPIVGRGKYTYKVDENWQRPPEWLDVKACAVSVDSEDRVYCFNRNEAHPIVIFDRDGKFVGSWGEGLFRFPHAIRIVRENDRVQVFDQNGTLLEVWPTELIGPAFFYVDAEDTVYIPEHNGGLISILNLDGERLARWGDGPVNRSCHGIWCDSRRDLYVVQPGEWGRVRRVVKYHRQ